MISLPLSCVAWQELNDDGRRRHWCWLVRDAQGYVIARADGAPSKITATREMNRFMDCVIKAQKEDGT